MIFNINLCSSFAYSLPLSQEIPFLTLCYLHTYIISPCCYCLSPLIAAKGTATANWPAGEQLYSLLTINSCLDFPSCLIHFSCPLWSQELDSTILTGPFQIRIFCDAKPTVKKKVYSFENFFSSNKDSKNIDAEQLECNTWDKLFGECCVFFLTESSS